MGLTSLLSHAPLYVGLQRVIGADRLRHRCIDELDLRPGDAVLDVGCGPAYYFERLPQPLTYHGFDTNPGYVEWARGRWGDRATFHHGTFDEASAAGLPAFDAVLLLGLLHHLSDDEARSLLELVGTVLAPAGRVVCVDTCFEPTQGRVSRWIADNDRGEHVRQPAAFEAIGRTAFEVVRGQVVKDGTRLPGSYWIMHLTGARPTVDRPPPGV